MTMHEHDPDTIMAFLEGSLDAARAAAVEEHMETCSECSEELRLQQVALEVLRDTPRVYLSAAESAHLHRTLHGRLGVATAPVPAPQKRRWAWRGTALGAAAVMLIAVLLVAPRLVLIGASDREAEDAALSNSAQTAELDVPAEPEAYDLREGLRAEAGDTLGSSPATVAAGEITDGDEEAHQTWDLSKAGLEELLAVVIDAGGCPAEVQERLAALGFPKNVVDTTSEATATDTTEASAAGSHPCVDVGLSELPDTVSAFVVTGGTTDEGEVVVIAYVPENVDEAVLLSHLVESCTIAMRVP